MRQRLNVPVSDYIQYPRRKNNGTGKKRDYKPGVLPGDSPWSRIETDSRYWADQYKRQQTDSRLGVRNPSSKRNITRLINNHFT